MLSPVQVCGQLGDKATLVLTKANYVQQMKKPEALGTVLGPKLPPPKSRQDWDALLEAQCQPSHITNMVLGYIRNGVENIHKIMISQCRCKAVIHLEYCICLGSA